MTLLAGPQVSSTVVFTLGFAGSAASLFWVLRRWGATIWPAALGGALYGFSPALVDSAIGHYQMQFAVLPPLIIDALLRIVTGRGHPVRNGAWLGLLTAAQLFTGEELLAQTALAGLVLVVLLAAGWPRVALHRARGAVIGLATGAGVALVICGYALWVQFRGPLTLHGSPWVTGNFTSHPGALVTPPGSLLFHTPASAAAAGTPGRLPEYLAYLGWPLIVLVVAAAIRYWRDPRVRPILADGAAAAVLAFSLHLARSAAPEGSGWARRTWPFAVAVLALLPLTPLPMRAATVPPVPAGWQAAFARLGPDARVLVVPVPSSRAPDPMRWQADTGEPGSLIGGWFVGPDQSGQATVEQYGPRMVNNVARYLNALWAGTPTSKRIDYAQIHVARAYWRPTAIVAVTSPGSRLWRVLVKVFGRPDFRVPQLLVWRL